MEYVSTAETAKRWGVSLRNVQRLLTEGRIFGARKLGDAWLIPADAEKPIDPRRARRQGAVVPHYEYMAAMRLPKGRPEDALSTVPKEYLALAQADFAYRRGNSEPAKSVWRQMEKNDERFLTATILATVSAISSGDYPLYYEIGAFLESRMALTDDARSLAMLSLPKTLAAVCMVLPDMTPDWLRKCDFSLFPETLKPFLLNLYALHLRNSKDMTGALYTAKASVLLCAKTNTFSWLDLDNLVLCAVSSYGLGDMAEARRFLLAAMELGLPYGFIAPFADTLGVLGGLMEECLHACRYSGYLKPISAQWEARSKNWVRFHNRYAKDNIATILSPREYQTAYLIVHGASCAEAARRMNLSIGRLKNILTEVYAKLGINKREQLKDYIL